MTDVPIDPDQAREAAFAPGGAYHALPVALWTCSDNGTVRHKNHEAEAILTRLTGNQLASMVAETDPGGVRRDLVTLPVERDEEEEVILEITTQRDPSDPDAPDGQEATEKAECLFVARDATLDHRLRSALVDSRQRFKDLVEMSADFAFETDTNGVFAFISADSFLGYNSEELVGSSARTLLAKPEIEPVDPFCPPTPLKGKAVWCRKRNGDLAYLRIVASPIQSPSGEIKGARGVARDETEGQANEMHLARAREQQRIIAHILKTIREEADPVDMLNAAARTLSRALSARTVRLYRRAPSTVGDMIFRAVSEIGTLDEEVDEIARDRLAVVDSAVRVEQHDPRSALIPATYRKRLNGGLAIWRDAKGDPFDESDLVLLQAVAGQLGIALQQMGNQEQLKEISETDGLTGLLNRRTFIDRLSERLSDETGCGTLVYVDLDNFKSVNDLVGHAEGDLVLRTLADAIEAYCGEQDFAARMGGDEFVLWLEGIRQEEAEESGQHLLERCDAIKGFTPDMSKPLGVSIGLAPWSPEQHEAADALMARADDAMYRVKHASKGDVTMVPFEDFHGMLKEEG